MRRRVTAIVCAGYVVAVLAAAILVFRFADVWWLATVLVFAPRWPLLVPAAFLLPTAVWCGLREWAVAVAAAGCLVAGPYMGLCVTVSQPELVSGARMLRVVTLNVQGARADAPWVHAFVAAHEADVVALQECELTGGEKLFGYHFAEDTSLALLSRFPIVGIDARDRRDAWRQNGSGAITRFDVDVDGRTIHVVVVHLETVRDGLAAVQQRHWEGVPDLVGNIGLRRWESEIARAWSERVDGPLLVVGDFNIPVESAIYRSSWAHLTNAFSACGRGYGASKHTRWHGVRIDHVLMDDAWTCHDASVDSHTQSDHAALVTTLHLLPSK